MVMDADEARMIVAAAKYPPVGNRSLGGGLHAMNYGTHGRDYYKQADDEILVVIQTEHIAAVDIADEIYAVPGIDAIFVGPNDLAGSLRAADGTPPSKELMEQTLTRIREAAAAPQGPLRPARQHRRRRPAPDRRGLAVHRRRQRTEADARRGDRTRPPGPPRGRRRRAREILRALRPGDFTSGRISRTNRGPGGARLRGDVAGGCHVLRRGR